MGQPVRDDLHSVISLDPAVTLSVDYISEAYDGFISRIIILYKYRTTLRPIRRQRKKYCTQVHMDLEHLLNIVKGTDLFIQISILET